MVFQHKADTLAGPCSLWQLSWHKLTYDHLQCYQKTSEAVTNHTMPGQSVFVVGFAAVVAVMVTVLSSLGGPEILEDALHNSDEQTGPSFLAGINRFICLTSMLSLDKHMSIRPKQVAITVIISCKPRAVIRHTLQTLYCPGITVVTTWSSFYIDYQA